MKKQIVLILVIQFIVGHSYAFLNFGGNYSRNIFIVQNNISNSEVDLSKLVESIDGLTRATTEASKAVNESTYTDSERNRIEKEYQLSQVGKFIGVDSVAKQRILTREFGISGLESIIQDRLFNLEIDSRLTQAFELSLINSAKGQSKSISEKELGQDTLTTKINPTLLLNIIDFVRKNPNYRDAELAYEDFNKLIKNQSLFKQVIIGKNLSEDQNGKLIKYLLEIAQEGLEEAPPIDFTNITFDNLAESTEHINFMSTRFGKNVQAANEKVEQDRQACAEDKKQIQKKDAEIKASLKDLNLVCKKYFTPHKGKTAFEWKMDEIAALDHLSDLYDYEIYRYESTIFKTDGGQKKYNEDSMKLDSVLSKKQNKRKEIQQTLYFMNISFDDMNLATCYRRATEHTKRELQYNTSELYCDESLFEGKDLMFQLLSEGSKANTKGSAK